MAKLFCARCNHETDFELRVEGAEFIGTCQEQVADPKNAKKTIACGHELKFPEVGSKKELQALMKAHNADNRPRLLTEDLNKSTKAMEDILAKL